MNHAYNLSKMICLRKYKLATEGCEFFVDEHIKEHEPQEISYKRTIAYMNKPFEYTIKWSFPQGIKTGVYHFKIELSISPNDAQPTTEYTVGIIISIFGISAFIIICLI